MQEELAATCAESYEAKSSATALTAQVCHFDGYTYADTGFQFTSCVTTTLSQCSDSTIAQTEKFDALDCTNSTVGGTCIVGCAPGYELASGDSLRALSENESVACLTGSLPACQVTRGSSSTNPVKIGVSQNFENVAYGASCQVACQRTSYLAHEVGRRRVTFQLVDGETGKLSVVGRLKSIRLCRRQIAGYTGSASTVTCNLDVVNGSVSLIGSLPNCLAALCAVDDSPGGMSHDCDRIAFLKSCYANFSDGYAPVNVTSSTPPCGSNKVLSRPSSALHDDHTVEGLDCSSLILGKACVVSCADGDTAAEPVTGGFCSFMRVDAVRPQQTHASFHSESRLPEHSLRGVLHCQLLVLQCNDFRDRVFTCGSDGTWVGDPTLPYPTCEALTCSIGDLLPNGSLSGLNCASWTMGESCAV